MLVTVKLSEVKIKLVRTDSSQLATWIQTPTYEGHFISQLNTEICYTVTQECMLIMYNGIMFLQHDGKDTSRLRSRYVFLIHICEMTN